VVARPLGVPLALCVVAVAAAGGGYFPTATAAVALMALWGTGVALAFSRPRLGRADFVFIGAFALLAFSVVARAGLSTDALRITAYLALIVGALVVAVDPRAALTASTLGTLPVCAYALATRLVPERLGRFDPVAGYRLSEPLQYWNALGIFAAIGLIAAFGLAVERRALAAAAVPTLALTVYFTFSRGAWLALAVGIACLIALIRERLSAVVCALVIAPWAALVVAFATRLDALTHLRVSLDQAAHEGARLALLLSVATIGAGASVLALGRLESRVHVPPTARRAFGAMLLATLALVVVALSAHEGSPATLAKRAQAAFEASPPKVTDDLNTRLFSFSGSGRALIWKAAWDEFRTAPLLGTGPGTFERHWLRERASEIKVRDAHSLFLETLAELGVVGLALLLTALLIPVYAAVKARRHPLVPAAFGAYVAYLVHAGVDWDWEMPAVTLTALLIGAALVVASRGEPPQLSPRLRRAGLAVTLGLLAFAFVGLAGNLALSKSARAARAGDWSGALHEAKRAQTLAPWSPEPDRRIGNAELALDRSSRARASYKRAIGKAPEDWSLWFDLARASTGPEQRRALARASALNPLGRELAQLRAELSQGPIELVPAAGLR
jgi:O-antigen ligase/polysaccharide polymerase Wzy-like membrane protein